MVKKKVPETKEDAPVEDLLVMVKGDHHIRVHPTQVGPWEKQGWSLEE